MNGKILLFGIASHTCEYFLIENNRLNKMRILLFFLPLLLISCSEPCGQNNLTEQQLATLNVECFNKKYNPELHDGHKISRIIQNRLTTYRKILQHFKMHKVKHTETTPVIKWAQTKQKIFVNFKLSHRQDSPPCSDIRNERFNIQNVEEVDGKISIQNSTNPQSNVSSLSFVSQCFFTNQKFLFKLAMRFNASIKSMYIDREGFGSYTIVGAKSSPDLWIDPFEDVQKAAIWQQMRQRYSSEMNEYFEMREKRNEQSSNKSKKKKKKRPTNSVKSNKEQKQEKDQKQPQQL